MSIKRFKQSQRFRLIVGQACFYATAKQIRHGVGDFVNCNAAIRKALESLEYTRSFNDVLANAVGQTNTWGGVQVQITMA